MKKKVNSVWMILVLYLIVALVWTFYRAFFHFSEPIDEFLFKPLIFLGPVFLWVKFKEKNNLQSLGFTKKNLFKNLLIGFGLGLLFTIEGIIVSLIKNQGISFNPDRMNMGGILVAGIVSLATGFSEEILNRGLLMNRLWKKWENEYLANLISNLFFAILHLPAAFFVLKYKIPYDIFTYELSILVLGFADGYVFARTESIFGPVVSHALWNWSVVLFK